MLSKLPAYRWPASVFLRTSRIVRLMDVNGCQEMEYFGTRLKPRRTQKSTTRLRLKVSSFEDDNTIPPYAILSHTWGNDEVSFHDLCKYVEGEPSESEGYQKIRSCCALAISQGYDYVWIDTCCIDKTSSAELSEAINSMYRWYKESQVCYAYLSDFHIGHLGLWTCDLELAFRSSRWFTRGWTLQELLAPENVIFYDKSWWDFGTKLSLRVQISLATGIQQGHMITMNSASVAQKMSWASRRTTTRVEDIAYSLIGIFDVNMPLIYGEGQKAFMRLQQEIVRTTDDESIFAWTDDHLGECGMLAQSPEAFAESGNVVQIVDSHPLYIRRAPYMVTNRGLAIEIFVSKEYPTAFIPDRILSLLPLNCRRQPESDAGSVQQLAIELENKSRDEFVRSSPEQLESSRWPVNESSARMVYIRPVYLPHNPDEQQRFFFIESSSLEESGSSILGTYGCQPSLWGLPLEKKYWKVAIGRRQSFVALLLGREFCSCYQMFGLILRAIESVVGIYVMVPLGYQTFQEEMEGYHYYQPKLDPSCLPTRASTKLKGNCRVTMLLKTEELAPNTGKMQHFVEITFQDGQSLL